MKNKLTYLTLALLCLVLVVALASCSGEATQTTTAAAETSGKGPLVVTVAPGETVKEPDVTTTPAKQENALDIYLSACEKFVTTKGFDINLVQDQRWGDESYQTTIDMQINYADGERWTLRMPIDEEGGMIDVIFVDGVAYCEMNTVGMTVKYKTRDDSMASAFEGLEEAMSGEKEKIASAKIASHKDGVYTFEVTATQEAAMEALMEEGFDESVNEISDLNMIGTYQINEEGYLIGVTEKLSCKVDGETYIASLYIRFNNVGSLPTIEVPADADDYIDADAM